MSIIRHKDDKTPRAIYRCDCCGFQGHWGSKDWRHCGTLEEIMDGEGDHLCCAECAKTHRPDCTEDLDKYFNGEAEKHPKPKAGRPKKTIVGR